MPSLKDLKVRIKSVKSTQKITKAMKMVAASKLRRAREAAEASRPYAEAMEGMVARLAAGYANRSDAPKLLGGTGQNQHHLIIVCTADRGLCGAFNSSIVRAARKHIRDLQAQKKKVSIVCIGKKGRDLLGADLRDFIVVSRSELTKKVVPYSVAESITHDVLAVIDSQQVDVVSMFYNHFKSVISQIVTHQQLMPLAVETNVQAAASSYDYEPEEEAILADILPRNFAMQLFKALLESAASEQGARMNAMENATKNAGEMIKKLTLKYNRTRQANITKELIEIISGAEAV